MEKTSRVKFRSKEDGGRKRADFNGGGGQKRRIPFSTVCWRERMECWTPPQGLFQGRPRNTEILAAQAKKIGAALEHEEVLLKAEAALVKTEKLEVPATKSLTVDSARAKVMVSRLVREFLSRLEEPHYLGWGCTRALESLSRVMERLYKWGEERTEVELQEGQSPIGPAVNLRLIAMRPEELPTLEDPNRDRREGVSAKAESNGLWSSPVSQPEKAAASSRVQEPARSGRTVTKEKVALSLAAEEPVQGGPPFSPAAQNLATRREALEQARAEHRRTCWEKYREKGR